MTEVLMARRRSEFRPRQRRDVRLNRSRLQVIRRRMEYLKKRAADYRGRSPSWDRHEAAALAWALPILEEWVAADPLFDVVWWGAEWLELYREDLPGFLGCEVRLPARVFSPRRDYVAVPRRCELQEINEYVDRLTPDGALAKAVRLTLAPLAEGEEPQRDRGVSLAWTLDLGIGQLEVL